MSWKDLFLSFEGRVNRAKFWQAILVMLVATFLVLFAIVAFAATDMMLVMGALAFAFGVYVALALAAKRLHDRDKSAWWLTLFYGVPPLLGQAAKALGEATGGGLLLSGMAALLGLWALVELGFLKGTAGRNRFGHDPLKPGTADASL